MSASEIVHYLLGHKLVKENSIIEQDLTVADISHRNNNLMVMSDKAPCYLLKQGIDKDTKETIANEASIYQHLHSNHLTRKMTQYLPRYYGYNKEKHLLILELFSNAKTLRMYPVRKGRFSVILARKIGEVLGTLHQTTAIKREEKHDSNLSNTAPPWILSIHRPSLRLFKNLTNGNIRLIRIIQKFPELCMKLDSLRDQWHIESLIHQDIKWDNFLLIGNSGKDINLKLIDWELSRLGDPCWDVGSVFADYLSFWIMSIPVTGETPPDKFPDLAQYPLQRVQPAILSFWKSYTKQMKLDDNIADEWLIRSVKYAAARLIQTAFEQLQTVIYLNSNSIICLQLCFNMLQRPIETSAQLLGIPLREKWIKYD
jgi:thiamine kinase-like enzyme